MPEVRVESWDELIEALYSDSWRADLIRHRSPYVFRGIEQASYRLETTLMRVVGERVRLEHHLLRNFRKYAHRNIVERDTLWNWLALAQHHGLPTRLLDWTVSPLVAAHFATATPELFDHDGAIWAVNHTLAHRLLPQPFQVELKRVGADYFTVEILSHLVESLQVLDTLAPPDFVLFFEPPSIDDRIVNQFALFSVMPNPRAILDEWLENYPQMWHKIIIPAGLKWEVRDKLDQANITERVLFPGLDGLSRWQKRYYTPRQGIPPVPKDLE
ncbi:MAG: FRG domain-containing protein [Anaerolineaceae bacterium]|nr:FRG domain-containing protein [Anaerolineaceae bacterium]